MRPPTNTMPGTRSSCTGGEKSSRDDSHGLTVCRSDDATSTRRCDSVARTWLAMASCSTRSSWLGQLSMRPSPQASSATNVSDSASGRHANQRDSERHEQLRQLEQERVDQLGAMSAHLDALRAAVDRYLQQGRKAA